MSKYPRRFILASAVYLLLAAFTGILMSGGESVAATYRFLHIHYMFLGFMVMLTSGLAYHFLPKINGGRMHAPEMVAVHFFLANIGLVGKSIAYLQRSSLGIAPFVMCSVVVMVSLFIFVWNVAKSIPLTEESGEQAADVIWWRRLIPNLK